MTEYWIEITGSPWPGHVGKCLWAPASSNWKILEQVSPGDIVLHYLTSKTSESKRKSSFVGYSVVKESANTLVKNSFVSLLKQCVDNYDKYKSFASNWLEKYNEFFLIKLENFTQFNQPVSYQKAGIEPRNLQGRYLVKIDKKVFEKVYSLASIVNNKLIPIHVAIDSDNFSTFIKSLYKNEIDYGVLVLKSGENLILYGPPGSGKTILAKEIAKRYKNSKKGYLLYTVHGGTDYYDLVARITPIVVNGHITYKKEPRWLINALIEGKVLILDEINRAQIDTALGPFFTYLEVHHRIEDVDDLKRVIEEESGEILPNNYEKLKELFEKFRVIGTLNIYDKTFLFKLGDALKRRFHFLEITTDRKIIEKLRVEFNRFLKAIEYRGNIEGARDLLELFIEVCKIKVLGIGVLKDLIKTYERWSLKLSDQEAMEQAIIEVLLLFFENDMNYTRIKNLLENREYRKAAKRLEEINYVFTELQ